MISFAAAKNIENSEEKIRFLFEKKLYSIKRSLKTTLKIPQKIQLNIRI